MLADYINALRNVLSHRHGRYAAAQRYDARRLIMAIRAERDGRAAALRALYRA
jgi:hypothetical protein